MEEKRVKCKKKLTSTIGTWKYIQACIFFAIILISNFYGLKSFTDGFLLRRAVLNQTSLCENPPADVREWKNSSGCWAPKIFERAVIVIIDALRYDFLIPYNDSNYYHNAFTTPYETSVLHPENSYLTQFIADAPTTTSQRLKGLTTGSLPTFIDLGSNFAGTNIDEDNLLLQWKSLDKQIVLLGDDTWDVLFHDYLNETLSQPAFSFNVPDLHGVDNKVNQYVFDYIKDANFDVLIAHYLGVDHVGHRLGPDHPTMRDKLNQMDRCVKEMMDLLDDSTLLIVMGDHGMDNKGNHGGDSFDEINSVLWMYSKKPTFGYLKQPGKVLSANQVDLVPTLSLLLGNPIPYGNLGTLIPEPFYYYGDEYLSKAQKINIGQLNRFFSEYDLDASDFLSSSVHKNNNSYLDQYFLDFDYARDAFSYFKAIWAEFSLFPMIIGFLLLIIGGFNLALLMQDKSVIFRMSANMAPSVMKCLPVCLILILANNELHSPFPAEFYVLLPSFYILLNSFNQKLMEYFKGFVKLDYFSIFITFLHVCSFGSNSFTVWEDRLCHFLIITIGLVMFCKCFSEMSPLFACSTYSALAFILLQVISSYVTNCREEQGAFCVSTYISTPDNSLRTLIVLALMALSSIILPLILQLHLRRVLGLSLKLYHLSILYFFELISSIFWIAHHVFANDALLEKQYHHVLYSLANTYVICILGVLIWQFFLLSRSKFAKINVIERSYFVFALLYSFLSFLQRPLGHLSLFSCFLQILLLIQLKQWQPSVGHNFFSVTLGLLGLSHFFTTGNQAAISSLDWNFAFIHSKSAENQAISAIFMFLHTVGAPILTCISIPLFSFEPLSKKNRFLINLFRFSFSFILYNLLISTSTVFFAGFFRRHLMVWKVFAPRFMLSGILLVTHQLFVLIQCFGSSVVKFPEDAE
ncbi:pig-O [Schizosaccharomyces pombe]|uniref:GPI ethanolamine phosphate transferase 3 n=1 Tax=Schizosaccharomyces pombe (strain 972 / ATCC 24843) TaxID=284812 RepID=GPI13_SCHPO|nr:putative pig-O family ethanolamine phosphate transferase [Schizosaccharomyces pombe]O13663.1 RecName: Full=GPI ethanolamine phosphate transferase 3; AltName: Full=Glycosylphosphatidylinositol-anchor biosynthesis protein 13 [Schizosaccharomyces pombe 972h-]BAA21454.1 ORF YLL031c [Schizosaccharomyces pombe]CAA16901.1 pig-O (predicted) [Schizosaccharomyces pombe]|eukprot:NP_595538.1 putative pig-O family ethanolamine phosphate transferase [Schizosaccharomyces pombe]